MRIRRKPNVYIWTLRDDVPLVPALPSGENKSNDVFIPGVEKVDFEISEDEEESKSKKTTINKFTQ